MKKHQLLLVAVGILLASCVSKKDFLAEQKAKQRAQTEMAKLRKANSELQQQLKALQSDTTQLGQNVRELTAKNDNTSNDLNEARKRYQSLLESSKLSNDELKAKLNKKEAELLEKEKALAEREKVVQDLRDAISKKEQVTQGLLDKVNKALIGFASDELKVERKGGKIYVSLAEKLLFKSGSADVESKGKSALQKLAEVLNKNTDIDIQIEGHTDNVPIKTAKFQDNWDLSVIRATSIVRVLTWQYKVDAKRVIPAGRSSHFPIAPNDTAEGKAKNRRVEIILSPNLDELMKLLEAQG
ncbi:MAG: OmpA family protein [Flammeovirgaceae bacterium]